MKQPAFVMVTSRQQRNDPRPFATVNVVTVVETDIYGSRKRIDRRVEFDKVDAYVAKQAAKYDLKPSSPHTDQIIGLRALRATLA